MSTPYYREFYQGQGTAVQGTWEWVESAGQTNFASVKDETAGVYYNFTHIDLDEYKWSNIFLTKGTYKITLYQIMSALRGIAEILFGTQSLNTKDCYNANTIVNQLWESTFILMADTTADLRFRVNGKNATSSNYYIDFSRFIIEKTG